MVAVLRKLPPLRKIITGGMHFDNGGINFASGVTLDCNYASTVAVFRIEVLEKGGLPLYGRNYVLHLCGDKLMLFNDSTNKKIGTTNNDGTWKGINSNIDLQAGEVYTAVGVQNGNEEHIYVASNGEIIDHNYRTDIGDAGSCLTSVQIGSNATGYCPLLGDVFSAFIYNRPISEDEIKQISLNYRNADKIPQNGLVFGCILDRLKYGDTPYDFVNKVYAVNIGTPQWRIRKPFRVLEVV